jgi:hypothetical protein
MEGTLEQTAIVGVDTLQASSRHESKIQLKKHVISQQKE